MRMIKSGWNNGDIKMRKENEDPVEMQIIQSGWNIEDKKMRKERCGCGRNAGVILLFDQDY